MNKIGRYVIISELGRGAMGIVYKASDPRIDREVALKVVSINAVPDQGLESPRDMFMREVRAAGRLSHPAIVTIHDAFDDKETQTSCIVMELVPGMTLEKILEAGHKLTVEQTLNLLRQVADGLDYAHRNQVIHRDMKPANILVTQEGRAKITDFGIAKVLAREGAARTVGVMGTPSYMSPEQVKGGDVDARSDIFSLGIILFTMLTGKRPFVGNTAAVMFKIVYEEAATPSTVNTQLAPAFDHVVKLCLAKDRKNRYPSARDLMGDLDDLQNGRPPRSQSAAASPAVGPAAAVDQTVAVSIPGLLRTQAPPSAPPPRPASPPVSPAQAGRPVAPPQRPPAPPLKPVTPNPTPAEDLPATMAMPLSELLRSAAQPAAARPTPAPPAAPVEPARPQPPKAPVAGRPLTGRTAPMPVPDLSGVSPPAPPQPPLPPRREGPELMGRTQPMRVPDLSALSATPPTLSPPAGSAPPAPTAPPLSEATHPTPPADFSAMPWAAGAPTAVPPASRAPLAPPAAWVPAPGAPTVSAPAPPQPVAPPVFVAPAPEPQPPALPSYHPTVVEQPEEPTLVSASPQPAAKSKLVPAMVGGVAVVLIAFGSWGIWKFRQSRTVSPAPPMQAAVQTAPAPTLPEATTAATPSPSPARPVEQTAAPVNAAPPVTRKTAVRKTKAAAVPQAVTSQPAPPPPQPQPAVAIPAPAPAPPPPNPEAIAKAEAAKLANVPHIVNVDCNFGLKEATFTFSAGGKTIYEETFKGKKKKKEGFLGLKGSYQGSFSHTITVPAGASDVSLHVVAKEGADLSKTIKMPSPGGFIPTLTVDVDGEHLSLNWKGSGPGL